MTAQILPNLVYAVLLVVVLLTPYAALYIPWFRRSTQSPNWLIAGAVVIGAVILTVARHGNASILSVIFLMPLVALGLRGLLGGLAAILLFAAVPWWWGTTPLLMGPVLTSVFVAFGLTAAFLPCFGGVPAAATGEAIKRPKILLPMAVCAIIGLLAGLFTAPWRSVDLIYAVWHHWGALLAPTEAWLAGGLPYRDFPIQYGLGPTALLTATCGSDCWRGIYATAITANALYFATLAGCAILLTTRATWGMRWLGLIALFCASFVWTGFPSMLAGPATTPAVAGIRFLSISVLLLHILIAERSAKPRDWIGHVIWVIDLLWSPEAAFFGTLIWWPYLAMRDAAKAANPREALIALLRGALRGVGVLAAGVIGLGLVVWLLSGRTVTPGDFLAYMLHPPGPRPANPSGTVWLAIASIALAARVLAGAGQSVHARSLYACLLGFLAAGIYYLSRSHDNNILNLFPLLTLVLLASLAGRGRTDTPASAKAHDFTEAFVRTMLAAMVAFVATCNFGPWSEGVAKGGLFDLGPARLIARFAPTRNDVPAVVSPDATAGLTYLRDRGAGAVVLIDESKVMPWAPAGTGWTGVNNVANFEPLPPAMIERYIQRGARAYHRPGWILVDEARYGHWVAMFETAYDVREKHRFGAYTAYYLMPR